MSGSQPTEELDDPTQSAAAAEKEVPAQLVAQSLGDFFRAYLARVRSGDSGVLPVIFGLLLISIVFQAISPNHVFLSADNLVNLFQQSAVFMVLAMAEIFPLLLGEIDLSVGYMAGWGAAVTVQLVQPSTTNWPWPVAILAGLAVCALIGFLQGTLISRIGVPSFIVTLGGYLIFFGAMLQTLLFGPFSGYPVLTGRGSNLGPIYNLMWGVIDPTVSWIGMAVVVAVIGATIWRRDSRRRSSGLVAPPPSLSLLKIGGIAVTGVVVVLICNINRAAIGTLAGLPWVVPIVLAVFGAWMILLERTKYGRYVYAIGGNKEAARRAGVDVAMVVTVAFVLCSVTAGIGGLLYASYLGGMSNNVNGGQLVLYAVAAAVIGGTSLFGGRGKVVHGLLGGLVIGGIYNGMYLLSLQVQWQYIVTGGVLLVAATIDAVSRKAR